MKGARKFSEQPIHRRVQKRQKQACQSGPASCKDLPQADERARFRQFCAAHRIVRKERRSRRYRHPALCFRLRAI